MNKSYRLLWTDITRTWLTATTASADQAGASIKKGARLNFRNFPRRTGEGARLKLYPSSLSRLAMLAQRRLDRRAKLRILSLAPFFKLGVGWVALLASDSRIEIDWLHQYV